MDVRESNNEALISQIEQLRHERDELRRDIEQLCIQQAGPSYLAVATKMHFQRTAALEREIENLKKKLAECARANQNLQEEISEAHRIKSQLADLHSAQVLQNKETEKQLKFFQSSVAAAFAERDQALMELEKSKEQEEMMSQKLTDSEKRVLELHSAYVDEKKLTASLEMELMQVKEQNELSEMVINKFFEIHERDGGSCACATWKEKCLCLLDDPSEKWGFNDDCKGSTLKYIASLEEELETLHNSIDKLQNNMKMGLDIEHHLKRKVKSLEKEQNILDDFIRNGLLRLQDFHKKHRYEVLEILEHETTQLQSMLVEIQNRIARIQLDKGLKVESLPGEKVCADIECRDVHITSDINSSIEYKQKDFPAASTSSKLPDASDALERALQEKVAALLLLSQQEERHLLERDVNRALHKRVEELQRNLSQVTNEKVSVLVKLAQLKKDYQQLQENSIHLVKHGDFSKDVSEKGISVHEQEGKLKNLLKSTYLRHWVRKDSHEHQSDFHQGAYECSTTNKKNCSMDLARFKVENVALQESLANLERLTSSVHRLHVALLKLRDDAASGRPVADIIAAQESIIVEANQVKTALGTRLPVSWSVDAADAADAAVIYTSLCEPNDPSEMPRTEKGDPVSIAGFEMAELLILAAQFHKEKLVGKGAA